MTILWFVALCVAAIAIVVLLGSVVHSLRLPVLLWDAVLRAGQLAIVRHWPGSGATCPFPGHYRSGRVPGKGWRDWCCWSYQGDSEEQVLFVTGEAAAAEISSLLRNAFVISDEA